MNGKSERLEQVEELRQRGIDIWRPLFHRQYEGAFEGRIRRQYMDLARPEFYPVVFKIAHIMPHETVLDLGCGDGTDSINLHRAGHYGRVVGVETPVPDSAELTGIKIEHIMQKISAEGMTNFELELGYAEEIELPSESFDTIYVANTLQHCYDIHKALNNIHRMLKPGGKLIAVTNHEENKPFHHEKLGTLASKVNGVPPKPHSSQFNSVTGPLIMEGHRHQFRLEHEIIQKGDRNLKLTIDKVPYLLASLSTYWNDIRPTTPHEDITQDELIDFLIQLQEKKSGTLRDIENEVMDAISASPEKAIYETIKRVAYIYRKRSRPASALMKMASNSH